MTFNDQLNTNANLLNPSEDIPMIDENKDYFAELVGEGRKFKDEKALAKSKAYSDAHIAILERQNEEYRQIALKNHEAAIAGPKLQELLDKLEATQQQLASREQPQNSNEEQKAAYNPQEVKNLITSEVQQIEQSRKEEANYNLVVGKLKERFGNTYPSILKTQAEELGLSDKEVNSMARSNPNLFMKTFDLNVPVNKENFQTPPKSDQRSGFAPKSGEKRTWAYYEELRKKDPRVWLDKKIAIQMEKDAQALGTAFYDT